MPMCIWVRRKWRSLGNTAGCQGFLEQRLLDNIPEDKGRWFSLANMRFLGVCWPSLSNNFPSDAVKMRDAHAKNE